MHVVLGYKLLAIALKMVYTCQNMYGVCYEPICAELKIFVV